METQIRIAFDQISYSLAHNISMRLAAATIRTPPSSEHCNVLEMPIDRQFLERLTSACGGALGKPLI
jgi:hypothetical protein